MTTPTTPAAECAANGTRDCSLGPYGPNGEQQCQWCGSTPPHLDGSATPAADAPDLHDLIMNLPCAKGPYSESGINARLAYKSGHRDARHAAAELATARETSLAQQHALELLSLDGQAMERESALVAERDAYKDHLFAAIEGDQILARALEMVNGTDRISPMQMSELLDVASANLARARAAEAERDALLKHTDDLTHKVICCGVAASHSDPELTTKGAYAGKWNSAQAEEVRKLRRERDALRAALRSIAAFATGEGDVCEIIAKRASAALAAPAAEG